MTLPLSPPDLYLFERLSDPVLHPDGDRIAYTVTVADRDSDGYRAQIWVVSADGDEARPYTSGPMDGTPAWSPDGTWLSFLRTDDGPPQLWALPTAGGDAVLVDEGPVAAYAWAPGSDALAVVRVVDLRDAPDAEHDTVHDTAQRAAEPVVVERLGYKADGAGLIGTRRAHLFTVPVDGGPANRLTDGDFSVGAPAWSPDGRHIAVVTALHDTRDLDVVSDVALIDPSDGTLTVVTDWDGIAGWVGWLPDGRLLLAGLERADTALHNALFTVAVEGGKPQPLLTDFDRNVMTGGPGYPGAPPQVANGEVVFCARDRGTVHLFAAPVGGGPARTIMSGDDRLVSGCSVVGRRAAVILATPRTPGELVVRDVAGATERRTSRHNAWLEERTILTPADRVFTVDGRRVHGRILRDAQAPVPGPLLLDIHGGPHNAWGPALDDVHLYHHQLAAEGWTVLLLNTIGSDGYGQEWYAGLRGGWGANDEHQFLAAVDALVAEGLADPSRLAVTGYSYGGYMTAWLVGRTTRFAAAITGGCVSDLASFYGTADLGPLLLDAELGAHLFDDPERYRDLSPLTRAAAVTTPTLFLHGEDDHRCPVGQAEQLFAILRRNAVPSRMVRYPGAGHLFILSGRPSHRLHYSEQVVDWLREHVG